MKEATVIMSDDMAKTIDALPAMSTLLPYTFANGSRLDGMNITCGGCRTEIHQDGIQGDVVALNDNSFSLKAYAICFDCKTATPGEFRFSDDGTFLVKGKSGWKSGGRYSAESPAGVDVHIQTSGQARKSPARLIRVFGKRTLS